MESCLYEGRVRHRRLGDVPHEFRFPLSMLYLDLGELDRVFRGRWLWSTSRPALARFHRADHLGDPRRPLDECVRDLVETRSGRRPAGPIRLLTQLRIAGYVFNPVSFFYCFGEGARLEAIVADVANTPWNERHRYVLPIAPGGGSSGRIHRFESAKQFYVSPFLPMDLDYGWTFDEPDRTLSVRIENHSKGGARVFDAALALRRREIGAASLARTLVRFPVMPLQIIAGIYWQAYRLRRKGAPTHPHPAQRACATELETQS